jgi:phospholipid-binding lipoprotein MlaA
MLPLLGPSDVRDAFGLVPDRFMSIQAQINDPAVDIGLSVGDKIDARARFLPYDHIIDASFDRYAMVRSIWFQRRDYKVHGGKEPTIPVDSPDVP